MRLDLVELATVLADWAPENLTVYVYGSRVRGDHRPDSDVDVCLVWGNVSDADTNWWDEQNTTDFKAIDALLPGKLEILDRNQWLEDQITAAGDNPVYHFRNIICVNLPRKRETKTRQ